MSAFEPAKRVQWILDCCPAPTPIACPSYAKHTELDWVYLRVIKDMMRSLTASSGRFLFSVTMFVSRERSILKLFLPCSKVTPNTCLCSIGSGT